MRYFDAIGCDLKKGDYVRITERDCSTDQGATWIIKRIVTEVDAENAFTGTRTINGPSESYGGVLASGCFIQWCSKWDGKRFRSLASRK